MSKPLFEFSKSRRQVAYRLLLWIVVLWAQYGLLRWFLSEQSEHTFFKVAAVAFGVASLVLLALAAWNWSNDATYRVRVTQDRFQVEYPGNATYSYDLPLDEIVAVESRHRRTHAGELNEGHWILMRDGESYPLTQNYFSSIRKIHKALHKARPDIIYRTVDNTRANAT